MFSWLLFLSLVVRHSLCVYVCLPLASSHNYCGDHSLVRTATHWARSQHQNVIIITILSSLSDRQPLKYLRQSIDNKGKSVLYRNNAYRADVLIVDELLFFSFHTCSGVLLKYTVETNNT
jgi:hypothetical protein